MNRKTVWGGGGVILWLALASSSVGQDLATVAQHEAARRQTVSHPAKVYTNADLATARPAPTGQSTRAVLEPVTMVVRAEQLFGDTIRALADEAQQFRTQYDRYQTACQDKDTVATTAGTFAGGGGSLTVSSDGTVSLGGFGFGGSFTSETRIQNETTPACRELRGVTGALYEQIQARLATINETRRTANIYPGVLRDLFAKYALPRTFER